MNRFALDSFCNKFPFQLGYCEEGLNTADRSLPLLPRLRAWLSPMDAPRGADLVFVLAGMVNRKEFALDLFRQGLAPRILFSVSRFEIRRFSQMALPAPLDLLKLSQEVPPPQRHYFVLFEGLNVRVQHVPPARFGTLTEIAALARWLTEDPDVHSVLAVSSATHLRRIRMCCRSLLNPTLQITYLATPSSLGDQPALADPALATLEQQPDHPELDGGSDFASAKSTLMELLKIAIYWILLKLR
jgi:uncharacterized SAM-binding protein YcdF (DUF218 family)